MSERKTLYDTYYNMYKNKVDIQVKCNQVAQKGNYDGMGMKCIVE
jgi:tagatose-1,6-bisphosphate aldolase non-catalytic subunit AgaZ/GatZ